ncbi:DUF4097 family beta strand repeat-containing protein [Streptomyces sp. CBMA152]|uniref:DUF4097 family beta strand repeat-containing protein n=1 Tax=Streptomyces sp. CBMA152 TaxID=1896312 RepID=UPI001660CD70|nr:DUF4097 family beta strand repeat-containing protein [Streptomyces sp. CBMA152]MBD0741945.1 hypothetical protein [Streptomyces sp. CBMA152]
MRARLRLLTAVATTGIALGGLSACGMLRDHFDDDTTVSEKITSVRLDSGSGAITLRGKEGATKVDLHRYVEYDGDRPGPTHHVENGVLVLSGCGGDCSVAYTVDLPAGIPVTGETSSGAVQLSRTSAVSVSTSSGAIDLDDVKGAVDVRASSGAITGKRLNGGPIKAKSSSGAIDLHATSPEDVQAHASSGAVTVTVPDGKYRVTTKSHSGGQEVAIDDDPTGPHHLDVTTSSGAINVKTA